MQKARVEAESSIELEQNCLSPTIESWKQTFEELEGRKKTDNVKLAAGGNLQPQKKKKKNVGYTPDTENIYETRRFTRSIVIHS